MADTTRLTKEEWADLEPRLKAAERTAHDSFMASDEVRALVGDSDKTPPYLLLQHLRALKDEDAVRLFRATEMYYHELNRADITAAFLRGREVGETGGEPNDG